MASEWRSRVVTTDDIEKERRRCISVGLPFVPRAHDSPAASYGRHEYLLYQRRPSVSRYWYMPSSALVCTEVPGTYLCTKYGHALTIHVTGRTSAKGIGPGTAMHRWLTCERPGAGRTSAQLLVCDVGVS